MIKMDKVFLRIAQITDAPAIQKIYSYYVEKTAITCEVTSPTVAEIRQRINNTLKRFPYLVAVLSNQIVGFAYVSPANLRAAYQWTVETSIYVDQNCRGKHIGTKLYDELEELCRAMGVVNMTAHIVYPHNDREDQYLTLASPRFHKAHGYELAGRFDRNIYKFDKWYDMIWMEKAIAKHKNNPVPIKNFNTIKAQFFN